MIMSQLLIGYSKFWMNDKMEISGTLGPNWAFRRTTYNPYSNWIDDRPMNSFSASIYLNLRYYFN